MWELEALLQVKKERYSSAPASQYTAIGQIGGHLRVAGHDAHITIGTHFYVI